MTDMKRLSFAVPPEVEEQIVALRKQDRFCRLTISEILRQLIQSGLDAEAKETQATT